MKTIKQRMAISQGLLALWTIMLLSMPVFLRAQENESDDLSGTWIIYNVDAGRFLYNPSSDGNTNLTAYWNTSSNKLFTLSLQGDGTYTIQGANNQFYLWDWSPELRSSQNPSYRNFTITKLPDGNYTLSNTRHSSNYLGWTSSDGYVSCDKTTDNINWRLLNKDNIESFRFVLNNLLERVDSSSVVDYYALLKNEASSIDTLSKAIDFINSMRLNMKTDVPLASWNEVAMTFFTDDTWNTGSGTDIYGNSIYCYWSWSNTSRNTDGECSLSARVSIDEASKLIFETAADGSGSTTLQVLIDGVEAKYLESRALYNLFYYRNSEAREELGTNSMNSRYGDNCFNRYFIDLTEGLHTIEWKYMNSSKDGNDFEIGNIGIIKNPTTISVHLEEPGSLGNEVLYYVDNINDVRRLKISGTMNDDDWARIAMMTRLVALDLSETTITDLPAKKFDNYSSWKWPFLHELKLPKNLETIGQYCFRFSHVEHIEIPSTVKSIGEYAFYKSQIHELNICPNVTAIGNGAFSRCWFLKDVKYNPSMSYVPAYCFHHSNYIQPFNLPSQITEVRSHAFQSLWSFDCTLPENLTMVEANGFSYCYALSSKLPNILTSIGAEGFDHCYSLPSPLPTGLKSIGNYAFRTTRWKELDIPESVTSIGEYSFYDCDSLLSIVVPEPLTNIGQYAFAECNKLASVEMPTSYYTITNQYLFANDHAIKKLRLKSPTMITGNKSTFLNGVTRGNVTLQIPEHLVTTYKQDDYWYTYGGFEAIPAEEINYWLIQQPLKLTYRDRFQGNPDVDILGNGHLTINGDAAMNLNNVMTYQNQNWPSSGTTAMVLSNCDNIVINGKLTHKIHTTNDIWYAMSLPFDFKVSDIIIEDNAKYAIRYYDGAHRAEYGNGGNWVDLPADTVVTAGTGFIYRTSKECKSYFVAQNNGSKQIIVSNSEFAKQLEKNESEDPEHKGWNLVGNPYLCYYNIHKLNTTAPITVFEHEWWNRGWHGNIWQETAGPTAGSYKAYSLIDDDYALLPNAAFFLQCPDEATTITFPTTGRQLTPEIEDQNGVKAFMQRPEMRKLIDLTLSTRTPDAPEASEVPVASDASDASATSAPKDQTRVVFNAAASLGYERNCDAGKFLAEDKTLPQLYTLDEDGTRYAINERPTCGEATVPMGVIIPRAGTYYIYVSRNRQAGTVLLLDRETGTTTDITDTPYSFQTDAGTFNDRFLLVAQSLATGVEEVEADNSQFTIHNSQLGGAAYDMSGRRVRMNQMTPGVYVVRHGNRTQKITVK